jgi:hypothetical protein
MPTFFTIDGIKIDLYYNDHIPPHFHAIYAEHEVLIEIDTLKVYRGSLPKAQEKKVKKWAKANQKQLKEIWEAMRPKS